VTSAIRFLTVADVLLIHDGQLRAFGGSSGIRDVGLVESAVMTPQASFGGDFLHADLFAMGAAYAFHLAENQPFTDGNKRAGLASGLVFLADSGFRIVDPAGRLYDAMIAIAERRLDKAGLAELFRELAQPR
jgi:death-on-curing protein